MRPLCASLRGPCACALALAFSLSTACGGSSGPPSPAEEASPAPATPAPGAGEGPDGGERQAVDAGAEGGLPDDAGAKPKLGAPIALTPDQLGKWVWIAMPSMKCSDGTEGGFAVNFTDASRDLLFFLQGGGICYDALTCAVGGAASSVGDDPIHTSLSSGVRDHRGVFDRDDATNPFRDSNFVSVPHCTGDHHTGDRVATYGNKTFHHVGYTNITRVLERVVPTFADEGRVVLAGFSAGGVGIAANFHQLASAFESVGKPTPYLVIDAGPFMRAPHLATSAQATLRTNWGLDKTVGAFCPTCATEGFHSIYRVNAELHPGLRSSLVCSYEDSTVKVLYSTLNKGPFLSAKAGLDDLADWGESVATAVKPSVHRVFFYGGDRHGALNVAALSATPGLVDFLDAQLGTGPWASVRP